MYNVVRSLQDAIRRENLLATIMSFETLCHDYLGYKPIKNCFEADEIGYLLVGTSGITPYAEDTHSITRNYIKAFFCTHKAKTRFLRKVEGLICSTLFKGWVKPSEDGFKEDSLKDIESINHYLRDLRLIAIQFRSYGQRWNGNEETAGKCLMEKLNVPKVVKKLTLEELVMQLT